jgi:hypothetical protein
LKSGDKRLCEQEEFVMSKRTGLKKAIGLLMLVSLLSGLTGCAVTAPASRSVQVRREAEMPVEVPVVVEKFVEVAPAPESAEYAGGEPVSLSAALPPSTQRMIIQQASLQLVVRDTAEALEEVKDLVGELGGYIANSNAWEQGDWLRASLTLRVPAESLEAALDQLKELAVRVQRETLSGEDVTEQYTDLSARLRNLEATETELLALLTEVREKPGATAEDILDVHRRLTEIRGEIEQVKGRMQYLEQMTALATINVDLVPDPLAQPVVEPGWAPMRTLTEASRSLVRSLKRLVDVLIWIVIYLLPILLLIAIPITLLVLLIRWLVRRARGRRGRKARAEEDKVE